MPFAKDITYFLLGIDFVDFAIDEKGINLDWDYAGYFNYAWSHKKFCKIVDLPVDVDLFRGF